LPELKEDALWLSQQVKVDEVVALRVVVLEWQKRDVLNLLGRSLEVEKTVEDEFDDGYGNGDLGRSMFDQPRFPGSEVAEGEARLMRPKPKKEDVEATRRKARLVTLFFSERAYLLATSRALFNARAAEGTANSLSREIGNELEAALLSQQDASTFVRQAVATLKAALATGDQIGEILETVGDSSALRSTLNDLLLLQIVSIFELITLVAENSSKLLSADPVKEFFDLMLDTGYFSPVINAAAEGSPTLSTVLQLNISLAGLAILKVPNTLDFINPDYSNEAVLRANETRGYYICSPAGLKTLQETFTILAENNVPSAALVMLAWTVIATNLEGFARLSGALDSDDDEGPTGRSSLVRPDHWRTDVLNQGYQELTSGATSISEAIEPIAQSSTSNLGVFAQISAITSALEIYYSSSPFASTAQSVLYELFNHAQPLVQYSGDTVSALLSLLGGDRSYFSLDERDSTKDFDALTDYIASELSDIIPPYLAEARYRYPRELGPFHQFLRALLLNSETSEERVQGLLELVNHAESYMLRLPPGFSGYREDPSSTELGPDEVPYRLVDDVPFFHSTRLGLGSETLAITNGEEGEEADASETTLQAGSLGSLVASGRPPTIVFGKHFSPLRYMVGALCTGIPGNDFVDSSTGVPVATEDLVDIVNLLATILLASHKAGLTDTRILDETYAAAEPGRNLLEIVGELFEAHLTAVLGSAAAGEEGSIDLLVACVSFFHAVTLTAPARLWSLLSRSRFLELDGRGGALASIVSAVEMVSGRYDLLQASIRLFHALVDASLWSGTAAVTENRALTRFSERRALNGSGETLPQRMASRVITSFTRTLLEVFTHSRSWRYASSLERSSISASLAKAFEKTLKYVYAFDQTPEARQKPIVAVLADAADILAAALGGRGPIEALVDMLSAGVHGGESVVGAVFGSEVDREVKAALGLSQTVIAIRVASGEEVSALETSLYGTAPVLVRLFTGSALFKAPVSALLERLITASSSESTASSLLGNLSPSSARDFVAVLGTLDLALENVNTETQLWRFLTAVISSRQGWFAVALLTGRVPKARRSRLENQPKKEEPPRTISLFSYALDSLSDVALVDGRPVWKRLPAELALELLQFVAACQNHWAWAVSSLSSHPKFIDALTKGYIRHLHREPNDAPLALAHEAAIAGVIAEILAMYLYSGGDASRITENLQYFTRYGVAAPKYSTSLHNNLSANLTKQHRGLKLESFKHSLAFPTRMGDNYAYDVPFASRVLNVRRTARGKALKGLEGNLKMANEDLSYVDAQVRLLRGWKVLASQLVGGVASGKDEKLAGLLIDVVRTSLEENATSQGSGLFENLRFQRVELAMTLLQKLAVVEFKDQALREKLRSLFGVAWDTIRTGGFDFDAGVYGGSDVAYYRAMVQILFLTLKPLATPFTPLNARKNAPATHPPAQATELIEVVVNVVIKGFRSLTSVLHTDTSLAQPTDFVLLTALLQATLRIPQIDLLFPQFALHFANQSTAAAATSLFSWSDSETFLADGGDPVYAELAVLFLLEMSSIPAVAEGMAVDGVLAQLASARIMRLFARPRGMGPFDSPQRAHSVWARGILPLCLNLLDAVGAPIAPEIIAFLNTFPTQLSRVSTELANRGSTIGTRPGDSHISLALASEVHALALLWLVLERYRAAGPSAGLLPAELGVLEWDVKAVREDVEDFVLGRSVLGPLVVPANEREGELARQRGAGGEGRTRLEERVLGELRGAGLVLGAEI
jgi:nuclear pore complex protein Nup188